MTKLILPSILALTIIVAGVFAFAPIDQASTVHSTIINTALGSPVTGTLASDIDSMQDQLAALIEFGSCSQATSDTNASFTCLTAVGDGLAFVTVTTTTNGASDSSGVGISVDGTLTCTEQTILIADSPYTCAFPIVTGNVVTVTDALNDDAVATAQIVVITNQDDAD